MTAEDKIRSARMQLVAQHPFFATLILGMEFQEIEKGQYGCDTMGTNGKSICWVREFVEKLSLLELMGVLVHEAMHAALLHPFRFSQGTYQKDRANVAMDLAINDLVQAEGFTLPGKPVTWDQMAAGATGWLYDPQFKGQTWEHIYPQLTEPPEKPKSQCGCGEGQCPGGKGHGEKPGGRKYQINGGQKGLGGDLIPNDNPADEAESKINTQKAVTVARQQGKLPAGMKNVFDDLLEPKIRWNDVLRWWMKSKRKDDYDPRRYNRRMAQSGIYLPTLYSEGMGPMVVVRDTSGSCLGDQEEFLAEIAAIMYETKPDKLILIDCDASIYADGIHEFAYNEGDLLVATAKNFTGGGGTSFKPPFAYIEKENIRPEVLVFLTDLYGDFPGAAPPYPVLWVVTGDHKPEAPFGLALPLKEGVTSK